MIHPEESFNILIREIERIDVYTKIVKDLISKRKKLRQYSNFTESLISAYSNLIALSIMKIFDKKGDKKINSLKNSIKRLKNKREIKRFNTRYAEIFNKLFEIKIIRNSIIAHSDQEYDKGTGSIALTQNGLRTIETEMKKTDSLLQELRTSLKFTGWRVVYMGAIYEDYKKIINKL